MTLKINFLFLSIVFAALKLSGVIGWSWWWVTAPLWGALAIWLIACAVVFLFAVAAVATTK